MADGSPIEWLRGPDGRAGATWNPVRALNKETGRTGSYCAHVTAACTNCYAEGINHRFGTHVDYRAQDIDKVEIYLDEKTLLEPLRWKRPRMIFPCSMSDLFGEWVPDQWIDAIFGVMALCPQHTFLSLTKRATRMLEWATRDFCRGPLAQCLGELYVEHPEAAGICPLNLERGVAIAKAGWPLPNVWAGATAHDQESADAIIPELLQVPAAKHWVSLEPMLGPIDLTRLEIAPSIYCDGLTGAHFAEVERPSYQAALAAVSPLLPLRPRRAPISWVICGGESGRGARPMHPAWAGSLRDQCAATLTPFFMKQMAKKEAIPDDLMIREFPVRA